MKSIGEGDRPERFPSRSYDPEATALFPGISVSDQGLRWGFIRKASTTRLGTLSLLLVPHSSPQVYGILACQVVLTTAVCSAVMFDRSITLYVFAHPYVQILSFILPLVGLIPLWCYRTHHPLNLALLGLWTATLATGIGIFCAMFPSIVVLEALTLTTGVTTALTAYTFWASSAGRDFDFLGPWLFSSLIALLLVSCLALFFPGGAFWQLGLAFVGAVLFSAYIVYDTSQLIKNYSVDEYVWASVNLYLDIVNLFVRLLEIIGFARAS